ncbi:Calcium/calmodulin-dependent protein kinase kinase [Hypsibius exemplaris]|uniref:calcium/calmodulin-dependent protein kinase n=1 Tax=Hypsibius exemplaris TaxID=2072580 RepID=A0A1W0WDH7_HYPEX|nr:Calcium/calmodulin-dependent protein kinase kinase [Hypsibius exemplaris]
MLGQGDKLKKLFRTSSSGNSIDGTPNHPLTISVSNSSLAAAAAAPTAPEHQHEYYHHKTTSSVGGPPEDHTATTSEEGMSGGMQNGPTSPSHQIGSGSGVMRPGKDEKEEEEETGREKQERLPLRPPPPPQSPSESIRSRSVISSKRAASIDQPATAAGMVILGGTTAIAKQEEQGQEPGFWAAWRVGAFDKQEIKSKLTIEGPGWNSGNIINKFPASNEDSVRPLADHSSNNSALLASLAQTLSATASALPSNGRTLPNSPKVPPPFPSQSSSSDRPYPSPSRQRPPLSRFRPTGGSFDGLDASPPSALSSSLTDSDSTDSLNLTTVSATYAAPGAASGNDKSRRGFMMKTPQTFQSHHSFASSMYHPASVPHLPLTGVDNETITVSSTGDGYVYLNQYKLSNETLGHGTYSIVKLAYNTEDNTHYAMKILSKKKLMKKHRLTRKSGDPMQEAYREIAILKKLNHPNIIRLVEVLDDPSEDSLYMVFELLERGEVLVIPTEHPLHESTVRRLFRDLILGVEYLHYNGILHRDLKPSNLLLDDNGRLKIADFGLSHMFDGKDDLLGGTVGTPAFHAPEILACSNAASTVRIAGSSNPASRSGSLSRAGSDSDSEKIMSNRRILCSGIPMDVWSMGITLFALVFGDVPFRDQFVVDLYNQIKSSPPIFPPDIVISDQLQDLIIRLLEKDPEQRITLAEMRKHNWVTQGGTCPLMPSEEDNCKVQIEITEEDVKNSVRSIPHLDTLILIKAMLKRGSFHHPFKGNDDNRKGSLDSNLPPSSH